MKNKSLSGDMAIAVSQSSKERQFWLKKFPGDVVKSVLPYDQLKTKKETTDHESDFVTFKFPGKLFSRLMGLSKASDYTLHVILAAVLVLLIHKYTGQQDIIVGTPIDKQEEEGDFINTVLALKNQITDPMTFKELLFQVRQTIDEAIENQNYPIESLLYDLGLEFEDNEFPLFDTAILLENIQDRKYLREIRTGLTFSFMRTDTGIEGSLDYKVSRYHKSTIERIINHYMVLMDHVIFDVELKLADSDFLSGEEKEQLLFGFNSAPAPYPADKTIHGLFAEVAGKDPDTIALIYNRSQLTYRQLNKEAKQLAGLLRQKGVQPDEIVGIMVERSIELVVGLLGILKADSTYLPLDPAYPGERLTYMLNDSSVKLLLTSDTTHGMIQFAGESINLGERSNYSVENSNRQEWKDDRIDGNAYVIYTSGSTGQPKGVTIAHPSILNTLSWRKNHYKFDQNDTVLQIPSFSFDSSVEDIFTPLISGSKLVLIPQEYLLDLKYLARTIRINRVTHFLIIPGFYKNFLEEIYQDLENVKKITVAGENFSENLVKEHFEKLPHVKLYNEYGPTETSVCATVYEFQPDKTKVLIGSPISSVSCYILGRNRELMPMMATGELFIAGPGLAKGYLNNPEFTAEKFCPRRPGGRFLKKLPPWTPCKNFSLEGTTGLAPLLNKVPGKKVYYMSHKSYIYQTGDLARWNPEGNLEFLGRIDQQVKIRGHRIELEEIEKQLLKLKQVKETVVAGYERNPGEEMQSKDTMTYLCAYIVTGEEIEIPGLKDYLSRELPRYMIPSHFMRIDKIPRTPNGKVDKKALPQPGLDQGTDYIAPQNQLQENLANIWSQVLKIDQDIIGICTDFFQLGGDSLKATNLISKIHKQCSVQIPMIELFKNPTIKGLAKYINNTQTVPYAPVYPVENKEYYPLSSAQKRLYVWQQMNKEGIAYNLPSAFLLEGKIDKERLEHTLLQLIKRHESLRTSIEMIKEEVVQRVHIETRFEIEYYQPVPTINRAGNKGKTIDTPGLFPDDENMIRYFVRPFDLSQAPLLRIGLIQLEEKNFFMVDMHHIISDGVSRSLLIGDFMAIYTGTKLPQLKLRYRDFTAWQNDLIDSGKLKKQEDYWLTLFSNKVRKLEMPGDYPRKPIQTHEGKEIEFEIDTDLAKRLKEMAAREEVTLYMLLFAVYNVLLAKHSGQEDVVVGTPVSGRTHADLENIIGMFVNVVPMRNYPGGAKTFMEFLKEVKINSINSFNNQDYPFDMLVNKLYLDKDLSRNPLFDTTFVLDKMEEPGLEIPGLTFKPYYTENKTSKFDMVWVAIETENKINFLFFRIIQKINHRETV
jgi:amino acid adenylation domain-containing protein